MFHKLRLHLRNWQIYVNGRVEWMKCFKRLDWNAFKRLRWRLSKVGNVWLAWIACLQFEDWGSGRLRFTWQKICYWNNWVQSGYARNIDNYLTSLSYVRLTDFTHCDLVNCICLINVSHKCLHQLFGLHRKHSRMQQLTSVKTFVTFSTTLICLLPW